MQTRSTSRIKAYWLAISLLIVAVALSWLIESTMETRRYSMILLTAVLLSAVFFGRNVALFTAGTAFLAYNFLLVEPKFTFMFAPADDLVTLGVFITVAMLTGGLAGRVRDQARAAAWRARVMTALFDASRDLSRSFDKSILTQMLAERASALTLGNAYVFMLLEGSLELRAKAGGAELEQQTAPAVAYANRFWAELKRQPERAVSPTPPDKFEVQILGSVSGPIGVLIYDRHPHPQAEQEVDRKTMEALAELGAVALDRANLIEEMTKSRVAVETDKLRGAVLSSISHDFRTPLAAILASSTGLLMHETKFDEATSRGLVEDIKTQAERLNRYVRNLLDIIKIESGGLPREMEPTDISDVINAAVDVIKNRLGQRKLHRSYPNTLALIDANPMLLEHVFINLLENAIKYSPDGCRVDISVACREDEVEVNVTDQGNGIPPSELEKVFGKFHVVNTTGKSTLGTGLGLSICRGFVEAMHGRIWAESPLPDGPGTRINIVFPRIHQDRV